MRDATRAEKLAVSFPAILTVVGFMGWAVKVIAQSASSSSGGQSDRYGRS